ncbi:nucleolar protein (nucleomorph) [Guillardia theta]|uniref:Nucleolar protein 56 n=1 Tax=Guillardia theta TaxID=55529 RepID=Q98S24_GUITH|nr:nucleolar protein [Guillardia theta]AAK39756.1 nucleolar protein [Guillardia theta]|mmetsp:Transcript_20548/g.68869  ORF Transcript_20548/g.68869 Transcript_20548/m.68869 type:complete len:419 (+) Transcript_20548:8944-10200(+)
MLILYDSVIGYCLFSVNENIINKYIDIEYENFISSYQNFSKIFKIKFFLPFKSLKHSLQNTVLINQSKISKSLQKILHLAFDLKEKNNIGVFDSKLAFKLNKIFNNYLIVDEKCLKLIKTIRLYFDRIIEKLIPNDIKKTRNGVAHFYSELKLKMSSSNLEFSIIQSSMILDQLDKDNNFFSTMCRELYSFHFPELSNLIKDNFNFCLLVKLIGDKKTLNINNFKEILLIIYNERLTYEIIKSSNQSIGICMDKIDYILLEKIANLVIASFELKNVLIKHIKAKMKKVCPNLVNLIGEVLGSKILSHAGSLKNLAKLPSSTIQILGAEKNLFSALKKNEKTPKYGIIVNSKLISKISNSNKYKFARYIANKISLSARIDFFSGAKCTSYGKNFKSQIKIQISSIDMSGIRTRDNLLAP